MSDESVLEKERRTKMDIVLEQAYEALLSIRVPDQEEKIIEFVTSLHHSKGIVLFGPQSSGKSTVLKLASVLLYRVFGLLLRTAVLSPHLFSHKEMFGNADSCLSTHLDDGISREHNFVPNVEENKKEPSSLTTASVLSIILDNYSKEGPDQEGVTPLNTIVFDAS